MLRSQFMIKPIWRGWWDLWPHCTPVSMPTCVRPNFESQHLSKRGGLTHVSMGKQRGFWRVAEPSSKLRRVTHHLPTGERTRLVTETYHGINVDSEALRLLLACTSVAWETPLPELQLCSWCMMLIVSARYLQHGRAWLRVASRGWILCMATLQLLEVWVIHVSYICMHARGMWCSRRLPCSSRHRPVLSLLRPHHREIGEHFREILCWLFPADRHTHCCTLLGNKAYVHASLHWHVMGWCLKRVPVNSTPGFESLPSYVHVSA